MNATDTVYLGVMAPPPEAVEPEAVEAPACPPALTDRAVTELIAASLTSLHLTDGHAVTMRATVADDGFVVLDITRWCTLVEGDQVARYLLRPARIHTRTADAEDYACPAGDPSCEGAWQLDQPACHDACEAPDPEAVQAALADIASLP